MMRRIVPFVFVALAGCATVNYVPTVQFVLTPSIETAETARGDKILALRELESARPYKTDVMARTTPHALEPVPNRAWAEWPRDTVTRAIYDAVLKTRHFRDAGMAVDITVPDYILTGELRRFDLIQYERPWVAECVVRLEVREYSSGNLLWAETMTGRVPLAADDLAALPEAMSKAVSNIANRAGSQIGTL